MRNLQVPELKLSAAACHVRRNCTGTIIHPLRPDVNGVYNGQKWLNKTTRNTPNSICPLRSGAVNAADLDRTVYNLFSPSNHSRLYNASLIVYRRRALSEYIPHAYLSLKAQDRAIRAEENPSLRHHRQIARPPHHREAN
jgi:hypothetical protein